MAACCYRLCDSRVQFTGKVFALNSWKSTETVSSQLSGVNSFTRQEKGLPIQGLSETNQLNEVQSVPASCTAADVLISWFLTVQGGRASISVLASSLASIQSLSDPHGANSWRKSLHVHLLPMITKKIQNQCCWSPRGGCTYGHRPYTFTP